MPRSTWLLAVSLGLTTAACGDDGGGAAGSTGADTEVGSTSGVGTSTGAEVTSSSGESSSSDDGGSTSTGEASSSSTGTPALPVNVSGQVSVFRSGEALADAEVCWVEGESVGNCTTTDGEGQFALVAPGETHGALRFVGDAVAPSALILRTAQEDIELPEGFTVDAADILAGYFEQVGSTAVAGALTVVARAYPEQAGYTMKLTPAGGEGPFYFNDNPGEIDMALVETASTSVGLLLNVNPDDGPFDLQFSSADALCDQPHIGGPLEEPWAVPAGVESVYVALDCE